MPYRGGRGSWRGHRGQGDIAPEADLGKAIKDLCDNQAARDKPRRLAAAFESQHQVILIFQQAPQ